MKIKAYSQYLESEILPIYKAVGWRNYYEQPEMLKKAYEGSLCILGAYEGEKLIGIIRAVGDGHSIVFIQDIIVYPEYQRRGIGTELMCALLRRYGNVYQIELATDDTEKAKAFYESMGFRPMDAVGCCGFIRM